MGCSKELPGGRMRSRGRLRPPVRQRLSAEPAAQGRRASASLYRRARQAIPKRAQAARETDGVLGDLPIVLVEAAFDEGGKERQVAELAAGWDSRTMNKAQPAALLSAGAVWHRWEPHI